MISAEKKFQIMRVARKYYQLKIGQSEIAEEEGISKSTVSRLLKKAVELGYVKISVEYPVESCVEIAHQMKEMFHLKDVFITPTVVDDPDIILQDTCQALSDNLNNYIQNNDIIGVSWGRTLRKLSNYIHPIGVKGTKVIQLNGAVAKNNSVTGAQKIVDIIAEATGGEGYMLPAPAIVDSKEIADVMKRDSQIKALMDMAQKTSVNIFSVGAMTRDSILCEVNYLKPDYMTKLEKMGAVGDIASRFIDINGDVVDHELDERIIGMDLSVLRDKKYAIAIAVGMDKVKSILGALHGGYINVLYTNDKTGQMIMELKQGK